MIVDSFRFLPRSFRGFYENPVALEGEDDEVWTPLEKRLSGATIALLSSAGLHVLSSQEPFDAERERSEPTWGDPTHRVIPSSTPQGSLGMTHLHVNADDVLADHEVALPLRGLQQLVDEGTVGGMASSHYSVMGYQEAGLRAWKEETAPAIVEKLRDERIDGLVLAPV